MQDLVESKARELEDLIAAQTLSVSGNDPMVNEYARGLANGLMLAKNVLVDGKPGKPEYLERMPDKGNKNKPKDLIVYGEVEGFQLINSKSSESEGWTTLTSAMFIADVGCIVKTTTSQRNINGSISIVEALVMAPMAAIELIDGDEANGRRLVPMYPIKKNEGSEV